MIRALMAVSTLRGLCLTCVREPVTDMGAKLIDRSDRLNGVFHRLYIGSTVVYHGRAVRELKAN